MSRYYRPVAAYRAGTARAVPHLWGTLTRECVKVGVVVKTMQYGHTTSNEENLPLLKQVRKSHMVQ